MTGEASKQVVTGGVAPLLLGLEGTVLNEAERAYIKRAHPFGFLLFARNIATPEQVRELCAELAELSKPHVPLIAVDQEGGRVQRVTFGGRLPPARVFGEWYEQDASAALEGCMLSALLLAAQLRDVGATVLLGPVLDLALEETHAVIGDRAFSASPAVVAELGAAYLRGVAQGGCLGCIKHAPGHGRATADSHFELPVVAAGVDDLQGDFTPFKMLAGEADFMMTAHICFEALDGAVPATYSPRILKMMREAWGFKGLIMADDIGMKALGGDYVLRARKALEGGCDLVIAALSVLKHGMAGTVYDLENFEKLAHADLPLLRRDALQFLNELKLPPKIDAEILEESKARLKKLWADGPARMGYALAL